MDRNTTRSRFIILSLFVLLLIALYLIYSHYNQQHNAAIADGKNAVLHQIPKENKCRVLAA